MVYALARERWRSGLFYSVVSEWAADGVTRREAIRTGVMLGAALAVGKGGDALLGEEAAGVRGSWRPGIRFQLNGKPVEVSIDARTTLLDLVREHFDLTGTKKGCDHGQCGACTVLIDGERRLGCMTLAATLDGKSVVTIEGLAQGDQLHPVQAAFLAHDGYQCGYCTPGQILSAVGFLKEPWPEGRDAIREGMSGNLCRCGAYCGIVAAVEEARRSSPKA